MRGSPFLDEALCPDCGLSHAVKHRLIRLKLLLPASAKEIVAAYPCTYKVRNRDGDSRLLYRDLKRLHAKRIGGRVVGNLWTLGG